MIMSNFISEAERHEELYGKYSKRHFKLIKLINSLAQKTKEDSSICHELRKNNVTKEDIEWMKRNGHYLPKESVC